MRILRVNDDEYWAIMKDLIIREYYHEITMYKNKVIEFDAQTGFIRH